MMNNLNALVFDLLYDRHLGIMVYIRIFKGELTIGQKIKFCSLSSVSNIYKVSALGVNTPKRQFQEKLICGEIGWFAANIRNDEYIKTGCVAVNYDENFSMNNVENKFFFDLLQELEKKPNLYCSIFPGLNSDFNCLKKSLKELKLQDSRLAIDEIESELLGKGFRCGFSGVLQREVLRERLEKEFACDIICAPPTVSYQVVDLNNKIKEVNSASDKIFDQKIKCIKEPIVSTKIITPEEFLGDLIGLGELYRATFQSQKLLTGNLHELIFFIPFAEFVDEFHEKVKFFSKGYAFLEYEFVDFVVSDIVKADLMLNGQIVSDLSFFVHQNELYKKSKKTCENVKKILTRQNFSIAVQVCVGKRVIARENISSLKKNVTGNLYGGDRTRKTKLWKKQKEGKKRMKQFGKTSFEIKDLKKLLSNQKK